MKIGGPKGPGKLQPPGQEPLEQTGKKDGEKGFERLLETGRSQASSATGPAGTPPPASLVTQITADLKSGRVTATQAAERLVEAVVARRAASTRPELRARLEAALQRLLSDDPTLAEMIRKLSRVEES